MKRTLQMICVAMSLAAGGHAQTISQLPSGNNKIATVSERVGLTDVTIHYSRPAVKGREGKIWGQLVHPGFVDQQFGSSKAAPWRAGANESTTIEFANDVEIEGKPLPAGKYGFFIAYDAQTSTIIFSKNATSWGSYFYKQEEDALRVQVKTLTLNESVERLKFEFTDQTDTSATIALSWEKLSIPFKVNTHYTNDQLALFRNGLRGEKGFYWNSWDEAARWCLDKNVNLEEALLWADTASGPYFGGGSLFSTKATKSGILRKLGRNEEAAKLIESSMPLASVQELHMYARELVAQQQPKEALSVFQYNFKKHPDQFTTKIGLARGYSANGDNKNALKYAKLALPQAPDEINKKAVEEMIKNFGK
ncbi:MAG: DUF2911 domain-containing protein [Flavitalea sp.]